jgi:hypothetical protein
VIHSVLNAFQHMHKRVEREKSGLLPEEAETAAQQEITNEA